MPNLSETRSDIESYIYDNVVAPAIVFDNVRQDTSGLDEYAFVTIQYIGSSNVTLGAVLNKRIRHSGTIVFKIYTPIDQGTNRGFVLMDDIKTELENKYISSNLLTYAAEPTREGVGKEGYFAYFLRIPFTSDDC